MGKTYKDQNKYDTRKKFPRVPPITKRSEPFEDKRHKGPKHKKPVIVDEDLLNEEPSEDEQRNWDDWKYGMEEYGMEDDFDAFYRDYEDK